MFVFKNIYVDRVFYVTVADSDIRSLKYNL